MEENGNTATPTIRSATASDTMKKFVTDRNLDVHSTAPITSTLPTITMTVNMKKIDSLASSCGSNHLTLSYSAAHALAFTSRITSASGELTWPWKCWRPPLERLELAANCLRCAAMHCFVSKSLRAADKAVAISRRLFEMRWNLLVYGVWGPLAEQLW